MLRFLVYRVPLVMPTLMFVLRRVQFALLSFYESPADVELIAKVGSERKPLLQPLESHTLLALARMQSRLEGDMAEVGVYQGASAKLICEAKGGRTFWAFDTFEGLQDVAGADTHGGARFFHQGQYKADENAVREYLEKYDDVEIAAGYFPESAGEAQDRVFSFVHLDVDTHDSTLASLRFFWPRMTPGGMIVSHDSHADGVAKAIATFVSETSARGFSTTGSQYVLVNDA